MSTHEQPKGGDDNLDLLTALQMLGDLYQQGLVDAALVIKMARQYGATEEQVQKMCSNLHIDLEG